jgi:hypothetical protein
MERAEALSALGKLLRRLRAALGKADRKAIGKLTEEIRAFQFPFTGVTDWTNVDRIYFTRLPACLNNIEESDAKWLHARAATIRVNLSDWIRIINREEADTPPDTGNFSTVRSGDVNELIERLKRGKGNGLKLIEIARRFTGESIGNDKKAQNLLRSARRHPERWK